MGKLLAVAAAAVGLAALGMLPAGGAAPSYNLTLAGASPGGLWSAIGAGMDAVLAEAYPGSTVTYQTSSGGLANIALVSRGEVPMGIATDGELKLAASGKAPFRAPVTDMRALFRVYAPDSRFQMTHLILSRAFAAEHGVQSFADIVAKKVPVRVAINRRGNLDGDVSEAVMAEMGASVADIESWGGQVVRAASKEQISLYLDRRIDLINVGLAFNHPRFREAVKGVDSMLLDVPREAAAKVAAEYGAETCEVKPGEYAWSPGGSGSVCIGAMIVVHESMDDATAYRLAQAMVEHIETFKERSHRAIKKTVTPQVMARGGIVPFHPGAARYYREKGLP